MAGRGLRECPTARAQCRDLVRQPEQALPRLAATSVNSGRLRALDEQGLASLPPREDPRQISVGWTLWSAWGLVEHQAWDFIYDGYKSWRSAGAPAGERLRFARAVFDRLQSIQPEVAPTDDLSSLSPAVVSPASEYYGALGWAASELLELADTTGSLTLEVSAEISESLAKVHDAFIAPRTQQRFQSLKARHGPNVDE
jgi:hypothetical protein